MLLEKAVSAECLRNTAWTTNDSFGSWPTYASVQDGCKQRMFRHLKGACSAKDCLLSPLARMSISVLRIVGDGLQEALQRVGCARFRSGESPSRRLRQQCHSLNMRLNNCNAGLGRRNKSEANGKASTVTSVIGRAMPTVRLLHLVFFEALSSALEKKVSTDVDMLATPSGKAGV